MLVHVYALCWNEEKMLPYFFKHYDGIADKYYIFDNDSTDNSLALLKSHPKVTVNRFVIQGTSVVQSAQQQYNHFWKQSKGVADWVIVCNVDEHFYHPNLRDYLQKCTAQGITYIVPEGYEMVSDAFPQSDQPLYRTVRYGARNPANDKPELFNPNAIIEINFCGGRHFAAPVGNVKSPSKTEVLLLHYKYLGLDYVNRRFSELKTRLREADIANKWGVQYLWDEAKKREEFMNIRKTAVRVI